MRRAIADELVASLQAEGVATILSFDGPYGYAVQVVGSSERVTSKTDGARLLRKVHRQAAGDPGDQLKPEHPRIARARMGTARRRNRESSEAGTAVQAATAVAKGPSPDDDAQRTNDARAEAKSTTEAAPIAEARPTTNAAEAPKQKRRPAARMPARSVPGKASQVSAVEAPPVSDEKPVKPRTAATGRARARQTPAVADEKSAKRLAGQRDCRSQKPSHQETRARGRRSTPTRSTSGPE